MAEVLKGVLESDAALDVCAVVTPVPAAPHKVYQILIDGERYFDFQLDPGLPKADDWSGCVSLAPNAGWSTPLNFETHAKFFGAHKPQMVLDLKAAIAAKM
jgi:hypothetical protein